MGREMTISGGNNGKKAKMIRVAVGMAACIGVLCLTPGCGSGSDTGSRTTGKPTSVEDVLQAGINKENTQVGAEPPLDAAVSGAQKEKNAENTASSGKNALPGNIDVDLTKLSSTMVYSEVFNMMNKPADYVGKIIKMDGQFTTYHDDSTGTNYFACIIQDATACCAQGMEFVLTEDYSYPADYPQDGDEVVVVGVFDTYMENDYMYCTLKDAVLAD